MPEDSELLHRFAREGDQSAFAELVTRHLDRAYAVALRGVGGDAHLAEDVAQIVFTSLARKAAALETHPALSAWVHRTAHYLAIDLVRTEARRRAREEKATAMQNLHEESARDTAWDKLRPDLDAVMADLPERDRSALALRFFDDRAFAEIGQRLGVSEDAARMRVDRALEKMRTLLARRGITCTAAALGSVLTSPGLVAAPSGLAASITTAAVTASASAAASAGAGTLVAFMSSTKIVSAAAVTIAVIAIGIAVRDHASYREAIDQIAGAEKTGSVQLADELRAIDEAITSTRAELDRLRTQTNQVAPAGASADSAPTTVELDPDVLGADLLERHPDVRQALADWIDAQTRFTYIALFRELRLTPEQIAQFLELHRAGNVLGGSWGPNSAYLRLQTGPRMPPTEFSARLDQVLGADGRRRYFELTGSSAARRTANQAASYLAFSDEPLTTDQLDELARVLHSARTPKHSGADTAYDWTKVAKDASTLLTPGQRSVLESMQAADRYQTALSHAATPLPRP